jgi:thioredoxin-related protein
MKKILCIILLISFYALAHAQSFDTIPPYQKDSTIPAFNILQTDSTAFNKEGLPKNKPIIIIYFSPECSHCQLTAHEFEQKQSKFKDVFFVWASYHPMDQIKTFAIEYNLLNANNVRVGRDTKYFIPSFFRVKYTPFIAVYDKSGRLIKTYDGGTDPDTVIRLLNL